MERSFKQLRMLLLILGVFLAGGFIHVAAYGISYTTCLMQLLCGALILFWSVSVIQRMIDARIRALMLMIAALLELYCFALMCRYHLLAEVGMLYRLSWYAYYLPMIGVPLLLWYLALFTNRAEDEAPSGKWLLLLVPACGMVIGILTNDLHWWAFSFRNGFDDSAIVYGPLYYAAMVFSVVCIIAAFALMFRKCRVVSGRKYAALPAVPLLVGSIWLLLYFVRRQPRVNGISVWNMCEVFIFMIVGFLECCIQINLLPANTGYKKLFLMTPYPAVITDVTGSVIYRTTGAAEGLQRHEHIRIQTKPIYGGQVSWADDLTQIDRLKRQIEESMEKIASRNVYLESENAIKEERETLDARNRLYDRIAVIAEPQLASIQRLLGQMEDGSIREVLAQISILNAFLKRRSNMELLKGESGLLPAQELQTAIHESLEYVRLTGADTFLSASLTGDLPEDMVVLAYEFFEMVTENCMETLSAMAVNLTGSDRHLSLRIMLQAEHVFLRSDWKIAELTALQGSMTAITEEDDTIVTLLFGEGGEG